ncbi:hypothetical protein CKJ56_10165 [Mycobacterium intracellulare subsp. chimaera]|nr:hypothetical protein CKJ58_10810 [Mycobacterium intracellulare subsp. chimaera]PBA55366.1 hypothetical protein CKJ57_11970 [Mycobacterium intracellulare subsp. chimaera]PBA63186.1 hypothetical protein CKJ56_10165 [Mycobacterium intracellulare subsp. chimaera]
MRGGHHSSSSLMGSALPVVGSSGRWRSPWQTLNLNHRVRVMSSSSAQPERYGHGAREPCRRADARPANFGHFSAAERA